MAIYRHSREGGSPGSTEILDSRLRGNNDYFRVSLGPLLSRIDSWGTDEGAIMPALPGAATRALSATCEDNG